MPRDFVIVFKEVGADEWPTTGEAAWTGNNVYTFYPPDVTASYRNFIMPALRGALYAASKR